MEAYHNAIQQTKEQLAQQMADMKQKQLQLNV